MKKQSSTMNVEEPERARHTRPVQKQNPLGGLLMKRIFCMAVAALMIAGYTAAPVMAAQGDIPTVGSITITGTTDGKIVEIYRIFDLTLNAVDANGKSDRFAYTINPAFADFFAAKGITTYTQAYAYVSPMVEDGTQIKALAEEIKAYVLTSGKDFSNVVF